MPPSKQIPYVSIRYDRKDKKILIFPNHFLRKKMIRHSFLLRNRLLLPENSGNLLFSLLVFILFAALLSGCGILPQPYSSSEFNKQAEEDMGRLFADQEPADHRIDLYEAMARAIKYNLEHKIKSMEKALAQGNLAQSQFEILPQIVASAGYTDRSNDNGSASKSLLTGTESLEYSTSQRTHQFTADIIEVWNVLDFGVNYTQAQQQADEVLIAEEWRRKSVQNIVQDVRHAYWKAISAELLLPEMDALLKRVESALERSRKTEKLRAQTPAKVLDYQQELLETVQQLWGMRRDLTLAKTELATLMNLKPGHPYELELDQKNETVLSLTNNSIPSLEQFALISRPELRAEAYQKRIGSLEARKALLRMLPGLEINIGSYYDNNPYVFNDSWVQAGAHLTWSLFNVLSGPAAMKTAGMQEELASQRRLSMTMMVLTQVNLAFQRYQLSFRELEIANQLDEVHQRKVQHVAAARQAKTGTDLDEIRSQAAALTASMRQGVAFAELQGALGRVFHSAGLDPLPATITADDLVRLSVAIEMNESKLLNDFKMIRKTETSSQKTPPDQPVTVNAEPVPVALPPADEQQEPAPLPVSSTAQPSEPAPAASLPTRGDRIMDLLARQKDPNYQDLIAQDDKPTEEIIQEPSAEKILNTSPLASLDTLPREPVTQAEDRRSREKTQMIGLQSLSAPAELGTERASSESKTRSAETTTRPILYKGVVFTTKKL